MKSTKTQLEHIGQDAEFDKQQPKSRWFRVIADRFDWRPKRTVMISWKKGDIDFRPMDCIQKGMREGAIELIGKPAHLKTNKAGKVVLND